MSKRYLNSEQLKGLAGAEAFTWGNIDSLPQSVSETSGPLVVKYRGEVVKMFPWHCLPRFARDVGYERESVYILDALKGIVVRKYTPDQYTEVSYLPEYRGIAIPV